MGTGPAHLVILGFGNPEFRGGVIAEMGRLANGDTVQVIDSIALYGDAECGLEAGLLCGPPESEAIDLGNRIGALIGLRVHGPAAALIVLEWA